MGCPTCSPGAGEASACDEINCLKRNVTIIVTTSPVPSNPSLELIDCTMHSFQHAPGLASCKKILVCDHYKISGGGSKSFRSGAMGHLLGRPGQLQNKMNTNTQFTGVISTAHEPKYREYKRLLADRITAAEPGSPYSNMTMLELSSHHGFGFAVQAAMERVATPLVMVVQHDRNLTRAVDAKTLVAILRSCEDVNMVSLLTKTTMHHSIRVQSRCMQALQGCPITAPEWAALAQPRLVVGVRLVRMLQWLDSTHIAKVDFYRRVVFRRGLVKRGAFIEDRIGNEMLGALRTVGASSALRYGCWIHDDGLRVPMVKHNHGRAFITHGEKRGIEERAAAGRASRSRSSSSSVDGEDGVAVAAMSRLFGGVTLQDGPSKQEGGVVGANGENIGGAGW